MNYESPPAQCPIDVNDRPIAWLHDHAKRYDIIHDEVKALWLNIRPELVEHYTIPLYKHTRVITALSSIPFDKGK